MSWIHCKLAAHLQTAFPFPQHYPSHERLVHFWDNLAISQAYIVTSIFSTSKGKLRRHKQMVFDQKQWSCAIDFFKTTYHRMLEVGRDLWWSSGPTLLLKQHHLKPLVLLLKITFFMPSPKAHQPKDIFITQRHLQSQYYFMHFTFDSRKLSCTQVKDDLPRNVSFHKMRAICQGFSTITRD